MQIRLAIRILILPIAALAAAPSTTHAQPGAMPPNYSRMRTGADDWHGRGGSYGWSGGYGGYGYGYNFFPPYYYPPVYAGSWYARPYPYHFDYYRYRWSGNQMGDPNAAAPADRECPCDAEPTVTSAVPEVPVKPSPVPSP
jgi:hypothetical protein